MTHPTYDMTAINQRNYENADLVREYLSTTLMPAEVMIFVKYREDIVGRQVLDIGCGAGRVTRYLGRWTPNAKGIDFSKAMIDHCRRALPHIAVSQCHAHDLSQFAEGEFNAVLFTFNGIDTLGDKDRVAAMSGIRRILGANGLFAFSSHNRRYRLAGRGPRLRFSFKPWTLASRTLHFGRSVTNRWTRKPLERQEADYAVLNDEAHDYRMLHYYVDREKQRAQLAHVGFSLLECYGEDGELLQPGDDDSESAQLYYVARRV